LRARFVIAAAVVCAVFFTAASLSAQQLSAKSAAPALLPGMGHLHHPIATSSPEAQRWFDQGLTLDYGFNHEEAVRSFRQAARLDPKAAMPWWGMALALGPNYNLDVDPEREKQAYDASQKALELAAAGPAVERDYCQALASRYSNAAHPDYHQLSLDYVAAMRRLHQRYPDDPDAATLYAESLMLLHPWGLWHADGAPEDGTLEILSVLESVLRRDPDHVGANHYYVHAVEASPHPEWALPSALRLETLVPGAGHLVHMPAHIYIRAGFYHAAVVSNQAAVAADRAYLAATHSASSFYALSYYSHNMHFLAYAAGMDGESAAARRAATALTALVAPAAREMPMVEMFIPIQAAVLLRFRLWDQVIALPAPDPNLKIATAFWHYARGAAFAGSGNLDRARAESQALETAIHALPAGANYGFNPAASVFSIASNSLDARIAEAAGNRKSAIESWKKAVAAQDTLAYDEPPDWFYPVRESLGGTLLRDGQFAAAEAVFREDLERNPANPRSLFGLARALEAEHRQGEAAWARAEFERGWRYADVRLTVGDL
jgi:tetratricopeptide (TPR) repeat protein